MHHAYAVSALNAGIHVLCEKPLAIDEAQCVAMIEQEIPRPPVQKPELPIRQPPGAEQARDRGALP